MFSRIANLFRGFLSLFISGLERQNPRALIEAEKENLRQQIARFNENLANHAGFCERLLRQVKNLEAQERDYAAKRFDSTAERIHYSAERIDSTAERIDYDQ